MLPGTNKQSKVSSSVSLYIRDLIHKEVLEEEDIIIIEDVQNTKYTTVREFTNSIIKDDDVPTKYRIYSSLKVKEMISELENKVHKGIDQTNDLFEKFDISKADKSQVKELEKALILEIEKCANKEVILSILDTKRDKNTKITSSDLDTSNDDNKIKLENLSREVFDAITGATPLPSNRPPVGGWITEDFADESIMYNKLAKSYNFGGHYIEGDINNFIKSGIYLLGASIIGLPYNESSDVNELRLLYVDRFELDDEVYIKQRIEYINDLRYRPIYRRVANKNRLHVTPFIKVEEINNKFKVHRDLLSDDFNNTGVLSNCDIFSINKEGNYIADETVYNLPSNDKYYINIKIFDDCNIITAMKIDSISCERYQCKVYFTSANNPVNTSWFDMSVKKSKFQNKTVHLFGDGILFGLGSSDILLNSISAHMSNDYGIRVINKSLGDATLGHYDTQTLSERSVLTQITLDSLEDADYVIMMIGTHDWDSAKASIGKDDDISDRTFKGSLNLAINNILEKNNNTKILLCTPFFRSRIKNGDNKNSDEYKVNDLELLDFAKAIQDIAYKHHIPVLDLYNTSGINKYTSDNYLEDGLYLNDNGHELIATKIINAMNFYY